MLVGINPETVDKRIEPSYKAVDISTEVIKQGGVLVFPWGRLERRCLAFMCDAGNPDACQRVNNIKNRPPTKVLAVNGYPELIAGVARIEDSRPLRMAAERLRTEPLTVLRMLMARGAISFIFEAKEGLPETVTTQQDGQVTIMIAGETDNTAGFDFYTELVRKLHHGGIITAGSSANRTTEGTYNVFQQEEAFRDLEPDVDLFIFHKPLPPRPHHAFNLESCTTFDMRVAGDRPQVVRFGSVNPLRFRGLIGGYTVSKKAQYLPRHEKILHILMKYPFYLMESFSRTA